MKSARFLFTIVGFGALTLGVSLASQPAGQSSGQGPDASQATNLTTSGGSASYTGGKPEHDSQKQTDGKHSDSKDNSWISDKSSNAGQKRSNGEQTEGKHPDYKNDKHVSDKSSQAESETMGYKPASHVHDNKECVNEEQEDDGKHFKSKNDGSVSDKSSHAGPIKKALPAHQPGQDRAKQIAITHGDVIGKPFDNPRNNPQSVNGFHQSVLNQPAPVVAKGGLAANKTASPQGVLTRRMLVGGGAPAPSPGAVPTRSAAATARLGELSPSSVKTSTAVINGTGMTHKASLTRKNDTIP
jgi:hypothetical protein